jgi:hypothetical protein
MSLVNAFVSSHSGLSLPVIRTLGQPPFQSPPPLSRQHESSNKYKSTLVTSQNKADDSITTTTTTTTNTNQNDSAPTPPPDQVDETLYAAFLLVKMSTSLRCSVPDCARKIVQWRFGSWNKWLNRRNLLCNAHGLYYEKNQACHTCGQPVGKEEACLSPQFWSVYRIHGHGTIYQHVSQAECDLYNDH